MTEGTSQAIKHSFAEPRSCSQAEVTEVLHSHSLWCRPLGCLSLCIANPLDATQEVSSHN